MNPPHYGNYCGPWWSDGKAQVSVHGPGLSHAQDEIDEVCKTHDACYSLDRSRDQCDAIFIEDMNTLDTPTSHVMSGIVAAQKRVRSFGNFNTTPTPPNSPMPRKQTIPNAHTPFPTPAPHRAAVMKKVQNSAPMMQQDIIPAAYVMRKNMKAPRVVQKNGMTTISHSGLITPVTGSTTFYAQSFRCNPGLASSFTWVARLARSYDKYRFTKLKYTYKAVAPTTVAGVVMMSFDYDALDAVPLSKYEHSQTYPNSETNVFASTSLAVKCDRTWRFVRQGNLSDVDLKTYDLGQFVVSTAYSSAQIVGELYVDFEVELDKPSYGYPLFVQVTGTGTPSGPFTPVELKGPAQSWSNINPTLGVTANDRLFCVVPGEFVNYVLATGTGLSNITQSLTTTSGGAIALDDTYMANTANTEGRVSYRIRAGVGDFVIFSITAGALTSISASFLERPYNI